MLKPEAIDSFGLPQLRHHLQRLGLPTTGGPKGGVKKFLQERLRAHIIGQQDSSQTANPIGQADFTREATRNVTPPPADLEEDILSTPYVPNSVRIISRIPKGARFEASKALTTIISRINKENTATNWSGLLYFASNCLAVPSKSKKRSPTLATLVKKNLEVFCKDYTNKVTSPSPQASENATKSNNTSTNSDERLGKIASNKIALGDIRGAIRILSSENYVLPNTKVNYERLKLKHPAMPIDSSPPAEPSNTDRDLCPLITREELRQCINSFKRGSGS